MTAPHRRSLIGRPYRRLRRWARHTPNGEVALSMMAVGVILLVFAVVVAVSIA